MTNIKWTSSNSDLKKWNDFLKKNKQGHYLQSSIWLKSYNNYGFNFEVLLVENNEGEIIAGMGTVIAGVSIFKTFIAPCAPIISKGNENLSEDIFKQFLKRAKQKNAFYCHINAPILKENHEIINQYCLSNISKQSIFYTGKKGIKIKYISSINGFRPVFIDHNNTNTVYENVFKNFNSNTKRNVKKAQKNNLELKFATTKEELKEAYRIIELNGQTQGYAVRSYNDMEGMLTEMLTEKLCIVPCCYNNNSIVGALILFEVGQRLTYISGGTLRTSEDLKVGHFLHNEMINYSINKGYEFYDISVGGSEGVTRFKKGFNGHHIEFIEARHWVLNNFKFDVFIRLNKIISKNKSLFSRVIKIFR